MNISYEDFDKSVVDAAEKIEVTVDGENMMLSELDTPYLIQPLCHIAKDVVVNTPEGGSCQHADKYVQAMIDVSDGYFEFLIYVAKWCCKELFDRVDDDGHVFMSKAAYDEMPKYVAKIKKFILGYKEMDDFWKDKDAVQSEEEDIFSL